MNILVVPSQYITPSVSLLAQTHRIFTLPQDTSSFYSTLPSIQVVIYEDSFAQKLDFKQPSLQQSSRIIVTMDKRSQTELLLISGILSNSGQGQTPLAFKDVLFKSLPLVALAAQMISMNPTPPKKVTINPLAALVYLNLFNLMSYGNGMLTSRRSDNLLDGGAPFYQVHQAADGPIAIGNLQPKFFKTMLEILGFNKQQVLQLMDKQADKAQWPHIKTLLAQKIKPLRVDQLVAMSANKQTCINAISKTIMPHRQMLKPLGKL